MYTHADLLKGNFFIIFLKTVIQLMKHLLHKHRALSLNLQHHKSQSRRPLLQSPCWGVRDRGICSGCWPANLAYWVNSR